MTASVTAILGAGDWWSETVKYEIIMGNTIWRFVLVLLVVVAAMAAARIVQFAISGYARAVGQEKGRDALDAAAKGDC